MQGMGNAKAVLFGDPELQRSTGSMSQWEEKTILKFNFKYNETGEVSRRLFIRSAEFLD